jgi:hypothetical protein
MEMKENRPIKNKQKLEFLLLNKKKEKTEKR